MRHSVETSLVVHGIAERDNKFLLVQEKDKRWSLPTGSVEENEDIITALKREVLEEAGAKCEPIALLKIIHFSIGAGNFHTSRKMVLRIYYIFVIEVLGELGDTIDTIRSDWFTLEDMEKMNIRTKNMFDHLDTYKKAKERNSFLPMDQLVIS